MQKRIVSLVAPLVVGIMALALGWFAHAALPLSAQGIVVDGHATLSSPSLPAAPVSLYGARLTYQGRLTNSSGAPINTSVSIVFRLYDSSGTLLWTSSPTRTVTPINGLFTVYLGDGADSNFFDVALAQAASIGVTVGGEELMPHQALNSVVGHSENGAGVTGSSDQGDGVIGSSRGNVGVRGSSDFGNGVWGDSSGGPTGVLGSSEFGDGVVGTTQAITRAGVVALNYANGPALEIDQGSIKVTGAGISTTTPVFIHVAHTSVMQNNMCGSNTETVINHPLTNGDANAILIVTPNAGLLCCGAPIANSPVGVFYDSVGICGYGAGKWVIYNYNFTANMNDGQMFNVLVVKP